MAKKTDKRTSPKKQLRALVSQKLETALKEIAPLVGKRKWERRIKKASRLLTTNVKLEKAKVNTDLTAVEAEGSLK